MGARIESVSVETYGVVKRQTVEQYLTVRSGAALEQAAINHDYANLTILGQYRVRLVVGPGSTPRAVTLRWIVMSSWVKPTKHPFYSDTPLSAPIQGVGFILTGRPLNKHGANISAYTQFSKRANLARLLYTAPLSLNPQRGHQDFFIADVFGGRGVYRASEPYAINVYSWNAGAEALYLTTNTNGTQFEAGVRAVRSTDELPSSIVAPSVVSTYVSPQRTTPLTAGVSHACTTPATEWYPPFCSWQYRFQASDAIGGLGATTKYRTLSGDVARYFSLGRSTVVLHASASRSGGVLPDSFLLCASLHGYPKPFCGTDAQVASVEYRINDETARPFNFVLFTETGASRVRGGTQSFALPYYTWHPDSGVGVIFRVLRIDLAYGQAGYRLTFELKGQLW